MKENATLCFIERLHRNVLFNHFYIANYFNCEKIILYILIAIVS
jgi:hypothetical protein